jgi:hypothetical protein
MINPSILKKIEEKLKLHHKLYRFPVKAELWEDIFDQSINGLDSNWSIGGHSVGADVICEKTGTNYQNKSGDVNHKKSTITWNGHRTTSHATIKDKVDFISKKHYDKYVMLGRNKNEWKNGIKKYYLITFDSSLIEYSKLEWNETFSKKGKLSGWVGKNKNLPYSAKISISMSEQLWTECDINYLGTPIEITIQ